MNFFMYKINYPAADQRAIAWNIEKKLSGDGKGTLVRLRRIQTNNMRRFIF